MKSIEKVGTSDADSLQTPAVGNDRGTRRQYEKPAVDRSKIAQIVQAGGSSSDDGGGKGLE